MCDLTVDHLISTAYELPRIYVKNFDGEMNNPDYNASQ